PQPQPTVKQSTEAGRSYQRIPPQQPLPQRAPGVFERQIAAVHLAGDYARSDQLVARFQQQHLKSTLLPAVLVRHAENAYFQGLAVEKNAGNPNRVQESGRLYDEAGKRYQVVIDKYPE